MAPSQDSQAQPEPKAVLPASANLVLKASKLPKSLLICARAAERHRAAAARAAAPCAVSLAD